MPDTAEDTAEDAVTARPPDIPNRELQIYAATDGVRPPGRIAAGPCRNSSELSGRRLGPSIAFILDVPRIPRELLVEIESTNHCTWRAHDKERVLELDGAREKFLELIAELKQRHGILIRSYCLMGSHPHVVCTSTRGLGEFSKFWKVVNQRFAWWFNRRVGRRGQVVMERMRSPRIQPEGQHQLKVMRYVDLNPVRAGLVGSPKDWQWSSYRHYAFGEPNPLVDTSPEYLALGRSAVERRLAYQGLFAAPLPRERGEHGAEFVASPFIGDEQWIRTRLEQAGLSRRIHDAGAAAPPRRS